MYLGTHNALFTSRKFTRLRFQVLTVVLCLLLWLCVHTVRHGHSSSHVSLSKIDGLNDIPKETLSEIWAQAHTTFTRNAPKYESLETKRISFTELKTGQFYNENEIIGAAKLSPSDLLASQTAHESLLRELPAYPSNAFSNRGYVILAGGRYSRPSVMTLYLMRRQFDSVLPIEVWMKDASEYDDVFCDVAASFNASCRLLSDHLSIEQLASYSRSGFQLKPLTILFSSFEEIIFMDADNLPGMNLDLLFEWERYRRDGLIVWPDYSAGSRSPLLNQITGLQISFLRSSESGQLMWNKKMHWRAVLLTIYYNLHGPSFYWPLLTLNGVGQGDKETYLFAAQVLGLPFYFVERRIHAFSMLYADNGQRMFGGGFGQANPMSLSPGPGAGISTNEVVGQKEMWCAFMHAHKPKYDARAIFTWLDGTSIEQDAVRRGALMYESRPMSTLMENSLTFVESLDFEMVVLNAFEWIECESALALDDQSSLCEAIRDVILQKRSESASMEPAKLLEDQLTRESRSVDNKYMWD